MSSPGCQREPSCPNGDVTVPAAGHSSESCQPAFVCAVAPTGKKSAAIAAHSAHFMRPRSLAAAVGSEDLRAPGMAIPAEEGVGAGKAALSQLLDPPGSGELRERHTAEVRRAERLHRQREVRSVVHALCGAVFEL